MNRWTKSIHCNTTIKDAYAANTTPIYQTATFAQSSDEISEYDYSRSGNPTRTVLEKHLAQLEDAKQAFSFTSGMAAISSVAHLLKQGDHIIIGHDVYGGTYRLFTKIIQFKGITVEQIDTTKLSNVVNAIKPETKLILIETPTNPLQSITDIRQLANLAHEHNVLLAVDNTLLSPWLQQSLNLGADIVIHSATKHLSGHSDVIAGVIAVNSESLAEKIKFIQNAVGNALAPFPAWLLLRGIKTLGLRIERQQANAQRLAEFLNSHQEIKHVYYPGLPEHPHYDLHRKQASGFGTVISFTTGSLDKSEKILEIVNLFTVSVSFGSLASLISIPCGMSHASIPEHERQLPRDLIRLSIGIEDVSDLVNDLESAIATTSKAKVTYG